MVINNLKFFGIFIFINLFLLSFISATVCTSLPPIAERRIIPENSTVNITLSLVGFTDKIGQTINLYIRERDGTSYDSIRTLTATIDANGNANVVWVITQADLDKTEECDYEQFYFVANDGSVDRESGDLEIIDLTEVYWRDKSGVYIGECTEYPSVKVNPSIITPIALVSFDPRIADGASSILQVWEDDLTGDDFIKTISKTKESGSIIGVWEVDFENMNTNDYKDFYFNLSSGAIKKTSHNLELIPVAVNCDNIVTCEGLTTQESCELNACDIENFGGVVCGEVTRNISEGCFCEIKCKCRWEDGEGCKATFGEEINDISCGNPEDLPCLDENMGYCEFVPLGEAGDCSTGFFDYHVGAIWNWEENIYSSKELTPGKEEYKVSTTYENGTVVWHVEQVSRATCVESSTIIPCPASIALPFFEAIEFVIAVLIIVLVYYFVFLYRKKKKKNIKSKKKVKIKRK